MLFNLIYTIGGLLFVFLAGHFVADYALQSDTMAREKRRSSETDLQKIVPWYWWLTAHAFTHGFMVWYISQSWILGLAETIAHWFIDFGKCEGFYGLKTDQLLHVFCKILWISYLIAYAAIAQ